MPAESIWRKEVVSFLTSQWEAGHSASFIADTLASKMAVHVTRSAVVGKIYRLDLASRQPQVEQEPDIEIPVHQRKTLIELTNDSCRWPVGDPGTPEFYFCGGKAVEGKPYCEHHTKRAKRITD